MHTRALHKLRGSASLRSMGGLRNPHGKYGSEGYVIVTKDVRILIYIKWYILQLLVFVCINTHCTLSCFEKVFF